MNKHHEICNNLYLLSNGGIDFLHSWFIDLYSKKMLSDNFYGGLAGAFANLRVVLCVNNLISGHVLLLLFGLATHYCEIHRNAVLQYACTLIYR